MEECIKNEMMTGEEYLNSLQDGREIFIYGQKVNDITIHPAFRNSAYSMSRLYDALHHPGSQEMMTDIVPIVISCHLNQAKPC